MRLTLPKWGLGTPTSLEFDYKGQNTLHWGVLYIIGKLSKCMAKRMAESQIGSLTPDH
jgi:hypothetical protein